MSLRSDEYLSHVMQLLSPIGEITLRHVTGGHGLFHRGIQFGIVALDELYFKVGEKNLPHYLAEDCGPLIFPGRQLAENLSFRKVPEHVQKNPHLLREWVMAARNAALEFKKFEK